MPTWSGISKELSDVHRQGHKVPFDIVRRKYLTSLSAHTKKEILFFMLQTGLHLLVFLSIQV
jgi:hypothetical protein